AGRIGDLFGRELLFVIGIAGFTASSVWAGLSADPLALDIARTVQGFGAGVIVPQVVGMIQQYFRGPERGRAFGIFGGVVGVAVAIGPTLGGFLIRIFGSENGWRAVFFMNLPVGIVAVVLAFVWFPKGTLSFSRRDEMAASTSRDLDPAGIVLLGFAVLAIMLPFVISGISPW